MKLLVINGPNINMVGIREPAVYGTETYQDLLHLINRTAAEYQIHIAHFQSNHEGAIIDQIQAAYSVYDGIIINPAGYTHTSVAILDALKAVNIPAVEVHISKVNDREAFRQISFPGMYCEKTISGLGIEGYRQAILYLYEKLHK